MKESRFNFHQVIVMKERFIDNEFNWGINQVSLSLFLSLLIYKSLYFPLLAPRYIFPRLHRKLNTLKIIPISILLWLYGPVQGPSLLRIRATGILMRACVAARAKRKEHPGIYFLVSCMIHSLRFIDVTVWCPAKEKKKKEKGKRKEKVASRRNWGTSTSDLSREEFYWLRLERRLVRANRG